MYRIGFLVEFALWAKSVLYRGYQQLIRITDLHSITHTMLTDLKLYNYFPTIECIILNIYFFAFSRNLDIILSKVIFTALSTGQQYH